MRAADVATASGLLALAVLVIWDSYRLGIGWGTSGPGSGFFPFWMGVILVVCCVVIVAQALRRATSTPFVSREALGSVLRVLLPAVGLVVLTAFVGLYVAAAVYLAVYMRWIGRHSWALVAAVALGFPVVTFIVFETWFLVPMPKGPVEAWLGY